MKRAKKKRAGGSASKRRLRGDDVFSARATIRSAIGEPLEVLKFTIHPRHFGPREGYLGPLNPGKTSDPTEWFDFYDDEHASFFVRYRNLITGSTLWAEVSPELGNESHRTTIDVSIEERLMVFHGKNGEQKDDEKWKTVRARKKGRGKSRPARKRKR